MTTSPDTSASVRSPDFTTWMAGAGAMVTVQSSSSLTSGPEGGVPVAVAVLSIPPWSTSAWVMACGGAVHVIDSAGASPVLGQLIVSGGPAGAAKTSPTATSCSVRLPVLVTSNE